MDEGGGVDEGRAFGREGFRLCSMDAQSTFLTPGSVQTRGRPTPHRQDTEPTEIVYFKFYRSQIPVIERAIETLP